MKLDIEAEALGCVGNLHHARDAAVVVGVGAHKIGRFRLDKINMRLQPAHMLKLENGCLD